MGMGMGWGVYHVYGCSLPSWARERGCTISVVQNTGKNIEKKVPKRLDKIQYVWYTKDTKKEKERSR